LTASSPLILTVTPNPSLDYLFQAGTLKWDDANRIDAPRVRPGGQGINVTRAARALGANSIAVALLGGPTGAELAHFLTTEQTPFIKIDIRGETRVFVGVRESDSGRSLLLNPRGPRIDEDEVENSLRECFRVIDRLRPAWVAACGSLPPGIPADFYARIGEHARAAGASFVPDTDGEALRLASQYANLLVPNKHEAERLLDTRLDSMAATRRAVSRLIEWGAQTAAITLGERGAVVTDGTSVWHAEPPRSDHGSAVGAGDTFLAALLHSLMQKLPLDRGIATSVAAGTAVLASKGSELLSRAELDALIEAVTVRRLD
jgi:1-phosphofructokinase family hexose kinase